ncbi:MAG TPA: hypothetical protein VIV60_37670, partial [Polyangiaceae bacterium]
MVNGRQFADLSIAYVYPLLYAPPPPQVNIHVAQVSFGQLANEFPGAVDAVRGRMDLTSTQRWSGRQTGVGKWLATSAGLGGWTLDVNHVYDPARILWRGDGGRDTPPV